MSFRWRLRNLGPERRDSHVGDKGGRRLERPSVDIACVEVGLMVVYGTRPRRKDW